MRLAVLVSGKGSILESILEQKLDISLVLADRECRGLEIARSAGVPTELALRTSFGPDFDRETYTRQVVEVLKGHNIDLAAMAGFMTVLGAPMFEAYEGRLINTHPSLLPAFKGAHAVRDALEAGATETGCTIHVATLKLDAGPILAQEKVAVLPNDTQESLHERIKQTERRLYPKTLSRILAGSLPSYSYPGK
jgi:phosphoribosylglycinamide formyltransferase-1